MIPIELATKFSTRDINERIVRIERLKISFDKIIATFDENAKEKGTKQVQVIHLQLIENIFYHDAYLFNDKRIAKCAKEFFYIKNKLDAGIEKLPLGDYYKTPFSSLSLILDEVKEELQLKLRIKKTLIILMWIAIWGIIIPGFLFIFADKIIESSIWESIIKFISNFY